MDTPSPPTTVPVRRQAARERWTEALSFIRTNLPSREFETWFAPAQFLGEKDGVVHLEVPNSTFAHHLEGEYRDWILRGLQAAGSPTDTVRCRVCRLPIASESNGATGNGGAAPEAADRAATGDEPLAPSYSFDSFVVGASNRCAHAAALAVSDPGAANFPYNPLLIYGEVGLGKTHLLHSIARRLREEDPGRRILCTDGGSFTRQVVGAIQNNNHYGFRDERSELDFLLVDDFQFIAGLDSFGRSTEELFHTLNALTERGRQIVLTANLHPTDMEQLDARIRSRLECGLAADIAQPDWETRVAIVNRKAAALGVQLPEGVAERIASRYKENVRQLEGALKRLVANARTEGVPISVRLLDQVLSGLPARRARRPSVQEVIAAVAAAFGVAPLRVTARQRTQDVVMARHVAMYLSRELTGLTLKEIGRLFGRDHSSVTHGVHKVAARREHDMGLDKMVEKLYRKLS